jgi:hypothetical protein
MSPPVAARARTSLAVMFVQRRLPVLASCATNVGAEGTTDGSSDEP